MSSSNAKMSAMGTEPSVGSLLSTARKATGLDDVGNEWFLGPLSAWVEDLQQPNLTTSGRAFLTRLAVRDIERRLKVLAILRAHPEIEDMPLPPIVYVTGLARSGTTLLHNLLAQHPRARTLRRWELMEPVPPPTADTTTSDPRIERVQSALVPLRGTTIEEMHWVDATDPEECVWGFIDALGMLGQSPCLCMPAWRRFVFGQDYTEALRSYRRVVQLLLWRHPAPPDGFLVLKAPQLANVIDQVHSVFPEARFVITDRDPYRAIVSFAVLGAAIVEPFCVQNPMTDDGRRDAIAQVAGSNALRTVAHFTTAAPARVMHVAYPALVADPLSVVRTILPDAPPELDAGVAGFLDEQRRGRRVPPPTILDPMGYDADRIWAEPIISGYCSRFGIVPEQTRLTGAPA